jgi:hypothetical protein
LAFGPGSDTRLARRIHEADEFAANTPEAEVFAMAYRQFLALMVLLAGCASPAERAERAQKEMDEMIQVYGPACERLGFKRDDDKWRECVLDLTAKDERRAGRAGFSTCMGSRGILGCGSF